MAAVVAEDAAAMLTESPEVAEVSVAAVPTGIDVAARMLPKARSKRVKRLRPLMLRSESPREHVAVMATRRDVAEVVAELAAAMVKRESTAVGVATEAAAVTVNSGVEVEEVVAMEDLALAATSMVKTKMASRKSAPERTDSAVVVAEAREAAATEDVAASTMTVSLDAAVVREAVAAATEEVLTVRSLPWLPRQRPKLPPSEE